MATETEARPAFYALASGGWRDYLTLLHALYTAWHLAYVAIGAALTPEFALSRLLPTLGAFFLAVGIGAHALDELRDRLAEIPLDRPVVLQCGTGYRSYVAQQILLNNGWTDVRNLYGGYGLAKRICSMLSK